MAQIDSEWKLFLQAQSFPLDGISSIQISDEENGCTIL